MSTTWKLWQALNHPPHANVLFQKLLQQGVQPEQSKPAFGHIWKVFVGLPFLLSMMAIYFPQGLSRAFFFLFLGAPLVLVAAIALFGSYYGTALAIRVSNTISRERQRGAYDLLCLWPRGEAAAAWLLCASCLHRDSELEKINERRSLLVLIAMSVMMIISFALAGQEFGQSPGRGMLVLLFTFTYLGVALAGFFLDYIQSLALSSLIGILIATYARDRVDARLWSAMTFLLLQIYTYVIIALISLYFLPLTFDQLHLSGWLVNLIQTLLYLVVFYMVREGAAGCAHARDGPPACRAPR